MIDYKVLKIKNPRTGIAEKYYPLIVSNGYVDFDTLANRISDVCTVTVHDVKGVLSALERHIANALLEGNSVRLNDLGSFHLRINSQKGGQEAEEDVSIADVKCVKVHFSKSSLLRKAFRRSNPALKFRKV